MVKAFKDDGEVFGPDSWVNNSTIWTRRQELMTQKVHPC